MARKKTELNDATARTIADALRVARFERAGYVAKAMAQRNLNGRTHYADDDTLKFFHTRINACRTEAHGLLLIMLESTANNFKNTSRSHRFVVFDLFGDVLNARDTLRAKSGKAHDDMRDWLASFDVLAHYKQAMAERAERMKRDADAMAKAARAIRIN